MLQLGQQVATVSPHGNMNVLTSAWFYVNIPFFYIFFSSVTLVTTKISFYLVNYRLCSMLLTKENVMWIISCPSFRVLTTSNLLDMDDMAWSSVVLGANRRRCAWNTNNVNRNFAMKKKKWKETLTPLFYFKVHSFTILEVETVILELIGKIR